MGISLLGCSLLTFAPTSMALSVEHYAQNSVLASGKWVRIKVTETGMQFISRSELRNMGFSDPSKVNVYGTGGGMQPEELTASTPDDVPLLPSVNDSRGILFFGTDIFRWTFENGEFTHSINPYSANSYYFLSDVAIPEQTSKKSGALAQKANNPQQSFTAHLVHEVDLQAPSMFGRTILGEDFQTKNPQTFLFQTPDCLDAGGVATVRFGAKTTIANSRLWFSSPDSHPTLGSIIDINSNCGNDFIAYGKGQVSTPQGEETKVAVKFNSEGAQIKTARLDYIELTYSRALKLRNGELHFYADYSGDGVQISGCDSKVKIWDVTNPADIREVDFVLEGGDAFFIPERGYREYVAFSTDFSARAPQRAGTLRNQNLHALLSPDMVIISPSDYTDAAEKIASLHRELDGMTVYVLDPQQVYNEFSGGHPDVMAFRKLLKMWHDRNDNRQIRYCLLMGRGSYDTKKVSSAMRSASYTPLPLWQNPRGCNESDAFSTDDIIGMLDDVSADAFRMEQAKMHVAVGRIPVRSSSEANAYASKLEKYMRSPDYGAWRNRVMIIADDQDNAIHLDQAEEVYKTLKRTAPNFEYDRVYLDAYPLQSTSLGNTYPQAKERMMKNWNDGVVYTNYIGHGSPTTWTHEKLLTWGDILGMSNRNPSFLYAATCSFGEWDADSQSGAELLVLKPRGGFIGAIVPSRSVYMGPNGTLNTLSNEWMLRRYDGDQLMRVGDVFRIGKNSYANDNKLRYCLMSDPALRLPISGKQVNITEIAGIPCDNVGSVPELQALSKSLIKGEILESDGSVAKDFNGVVEVDLYDAETVIETLGNGKDGDTRTYNDRKVKLCRVSAKVTEGVWQTEIFLPSEIENNRTSARLVAYAYDGQGNEAQGSTENLYVWGYSDEVISDEEPPVIKNLKVNFYDYAEGLTVNGNPVIHAAVYDDSGINVSDTGIGNKMNLMLDNGEVLTDLNQYYTPDPNDCRGGFISYPLKDLKAGLRTLTLTVSDNVGNRASKELTFKVGSTKDPGICSLRADRSPAVTEVNFIAELDIPNTQLNCTLEVFDLMGRKVWTNEVNDVVDMSGNISFHWNLRDDSGNRVPRGIYLYRLSVKTAEGRWSSQTQRVAVAAGS